MNVEALKTELFTYCQNNHLTKFAPDEIVELLHDGETVDWVMSMLVPAEQQNQHSHLVELLTGIRQEVYQEPAAASSQETAVEAALDAETGIELSPEEQTAEEAELANMAMSMLPPGVDARQFKKFMSSPQGALMADFALFCQEKGVDMQNFGGGKIASAGVPDDIHSLQQEWMKTPREGLQGKTPGELLDGRPLIPQKVETIRRSEPKVGRNDPCPCGSGKKYKKCHGVESA
jgi:hypothetical protein